MKIASSWSYEVIPGAAGIRHPRRLSTTQRLAGQWRRPVIWSLLLLLAEMPPAAAQVEEEEGEDESTRLYLTREERREAGIEHRLTSWLTAGGLLEWETALERRSGDRGGATERESDITVDLGLTAEVSEVLKGEIELEFDSGTSDLFADEAVVILEHEPFELSLGRQFLPFGVFYSAFATDPLLEFGETRVTGAILTHDFDDRAEASVSLYRGRSREFETGSHDLNAALGVEAWVTENFSMALGYMGNLADADGRLLEDEGNRFSRRIPGLSGHLLWTTDQFELSFEALGAARSFPELDTDRDRPWAWSLEFVRFTDPRFDWALRIEGSEELQDEPGLRYGASVSFRFHPRAFLTLEYLHGRFENGLASDDDDNPFDRVNQAGVMLSVVF